MIALGVGCHWLRGGGLVAKFAGGGVPLGKVVIGKLRGGMREAKFDVKGAQINPLFLQPTTARPPRIVQLALRLMW